MKNFYYIIIIIMFSFFKNVNANVNNSFYDFSFKEIDGKTIQLSDYKDKVVLVVNVASRCGFTNQYKGLQELWTSYKDKGLVVLGVPSNNFKQEPGSNEEIKSFCEANFDVNFPIVEKSNIIGSNAHDFYKWAKEDYGFSAIPKWNFHKIIVNKNGKIVGAFNSITKPTSKKIVNLIE